MNDRFKYRVWDGEKKAYAHEGYVVTQLGLVGTYDPFVGLIRNINCTVEQCTGLTDKNGKPIYEGDVVKTVFPDGSSSMRKIVYCMEQARYFLSPYPDKDFPIYWDCKKETVDFFEVIGNIHEKELRSELP